MNYYSAERNVQILISVMKANNIKKIIISPGSTNVCFAYSVQQDPFFELYSVVDERSAAYMACGLAEESGEVVALSCTGATASRNYMPALTEAYYRKLPILVITSSQPNNRIGHNIPQVTNRLHPIADTVKLSVTAKYVYSADDEWECEDQVNKAVLEVMRKGYGPVHINLITLWSHDFSVKELPDTRVVRRIISKEDCPDIPKGKVAIFVGNHSRWSTELIAEVEKFCEKYNAIVLSDHTGNYKGRHFVLGNMIYCQENRDDRLNSFDLVIHLGNISGAYFAVRTKNVWRVDTDGELKDTFRRLKYVFEMEEIEFFKIYNSKNTNSATSDRQIDLWKRKDSELRSKIKELPLSNIWVAQQTTEILPENSELHLGILNSLRSWSLFNVPESVNVYSNTGGFGIDGCISSLIGASWHDRNKIYYGVVGDLAFFYDLNSVGNKNVGGNVRIILVNNGVGTEFKNYNNNGALFGEDADAYIAARGHFGNKSRSLVKDYASNLGFDYYSAETKEDYLEILPLIKSSEVREKPMLVEVFTDSVDESNALKAIRTLDGSKTVSKAYQRPERFQPMDNMEFVTWGAGICFRKNIANVKEICNVKCTFDNNSDLWGQEIVDGIECLPPSKLKDIDDCFVIIMTDNYKAAFSIASQLLDMGIPNFDMVGNWLKYAKEE